jgi:hypothetical protein
MILFGQVPDEHVQRHVVFGESRRYFLREKHVRAICDAERTFERVVVGDRDQRNSTPKTRLINALGRRVRLAEGRATGSA